MKPTERKDDTHCGPETPRSSGFLEGVKHGVWTIPVVAFLIVVLYVVLGRTRLSETGIHFLNALIYSTLIGLPSAALLSWVSHRYTNSLGRWILLPQTLILAVTALAGSFAAAVILQLTHLIGGSYWREFHDSRPFAVVITLVVGLGMTTYETLRARFQKATIELRTQEAERERAYKLLAEARLSSLESRIHPHFLFNTLNSIASLIPSDPRRAEDTVAKLASLLRFSLTSNQHGLVPLAQELKIVRDYLEIESTRFNSRLRYNIDVAESLGNLKTPPLALQSLVENAVKHVVSRRTEGGAIHVAAAQADSQLRLEVTDDGPGFSMDAITPDHGLGNLMGRMELLFGERGRLGVERRDGRTVVSLVFPAEI